MTRISVKELMKVKAVFKFALLRILAGIVLLAPMLRASAQGFHGESWNAYGQFTYIWHQKSSFPAAYTNLNGSPNSLLPELERSHTVTATEFIGFKPWNGGELYAAPELISELPFSTLHGLGGSVQNAELEKLGGQTPTLYLSRLFLRQTWNFGGSESAVESGPMQLATSVASRRLVLTAGKLAIIDVFDRNTFAGDVRQQFMSMNFLTQAAFDFSADARGYTWGLAGEYCYDDWALRLGRFIGPSEPNQLQLNYSIMTYHGDNLEIEHKHVVNGQPGKIHLLLYRNVANMGRWDDAIGAFQADPTKNATTCTGFNYGSSNAGAPDLCWARKRNTKTGIGVNVEQSFSKDVGVFVRIMRSDGHTEVDSFTSTDSSASLGTIIRGAAWRREQDSVGVGYAQNRLSSAHVTYLNMGGIDGFIGDGRISYKPEIAMEIYYNLNLNRFLWISMDAQRVLNPAYNSDRGPVDIYGFRLHAEF